MNLLVHSDRKIKAASDLLIGSQFEGFVSGYKKWTSRVDFANLAFRKLDAFNQV